MPDLPYPPDLAELAAQLGDGSLITDPASTAAYAQDWCKAGAAGVPLAVLRATSAAEVQAGMRWAAARGIPVVPRGAGSGLSGGSNAIDGCLTISLDRMTGVQIDPATRTST